MSAEIRSGLEPQDIRVGPDLSLRAIFWDTGSDRKDTGVLASQSDTVVLLHGMGDSADNWRPVLRHWRAPRSHRVFAFDLPGHGQSDPLPEGAYREELIAIRIAAALHSLGATRPILVGHSRGARIALRLLREGIEPAQIILIDMAAVDQHPNHAAIAAHIRKMAEPAFSRQLLVTLCAEKLPLVDIESLTEVIETRAVKTVSGWRLPVDLNCLALLDEPTAPEALASLSALTCPVTFIRGALSAILNRQELTRLKDVTKTPVAIYEIPRAGHALLIEQPKELAEVLVQRTMVIPEPRLGQTDSEIAVERRVGEA
jgi:pimeloyl-ACP methyl ester carboxylesterase